MIKKISFSVLLWFFATILFAQIKSDTILYEGKNIDDIPVYIINDGIYYKWQWNKRNKAYLLFKDALQLPVKIPNINIDAYCHDNKNNKIYFWFYDCKVFDLNTDSLTQFLPKVDNCTVMANNKIYYTDYPSLCIRDIATHKMIDSINICKDFEYHLIHEIIKFPNSNKVWLVLADIDGGEIVDEQYCVYDEISRQYSLVKNNDMLKKINEDEHYVVGCYDLSGKYVFRGGFIYDANFNVFNKIKKFNVNIYGLVISNREVKQLLLKSRLDLQEGEKENTEVLIPFIPSPFREKAIYEIYENIELKAEDLKQLDAFDLRILRNMIFAKHNYAFKSKFLQAYFNLYGFYGYDDKQKSRITDVSKMLTPADRKNLVLIQKISKQN